MKLLPALLSLLISTTASVASLKEVPVPQDFGNWTIAFTRGDNIWTANGDGSGQQLVIKHAGVPCWSPDKNKIAFYRSGNIWVAKADGKEQRQLTRFGKGHGYDPDDIRITWSKRNDVITFSRPDVMHVRSSATGKTSEIAGTSIFDIDSVATNRPKASVRFDISDSGAGFNFANNDNPAWSKSGNLLAFTRNGDIWLAEYFPIEDGGRAGWDIHRLLAVASYDSPTYRASRVNTGVTKLSWSPDEKHLAYCLNRIGGSGIAQLHVIHIQQQKAPKNRKLLDLWESAEGEIFQPEGASFSPDGKWIATAASQKLYAVSLEGDRIVKIIENATNPEW